MNGCDHQPVQLNLPKALSAMQASTDEVEVRFSSMKEYVEAVSPYKEQLPIVEEVEILRNILYAGVWSRYGQIRCSRKGTDKKE